MDQETVTYSTTSDGKYIRAHFNGQRMNGWHYSLSSLRYWAQTHGYKHVIKAVNTLSWYW